MDRSLKGKKAHITGHLTHIHTHTRLHTPMKTKWFMTNHKKKKNVQCSWKIVRRENNMKTLAASSAFNILQRKYESVYYNFHITFSGRCLSSYHRIFYFDQNIYRSRQWIIWINKRHRIHNVRTEKKKYCSK